MTTRLIMPEGFGRPFVRSDGRWVVPYKPAGGETIKITIPRKEQVKTEKQALEWAAGKILQQKLDGTLPVRARAAEGPTIRQKYEDWMKLREPDDELAGATVDGNKTHFVLHILPKLGDLPVAVLAETSGQARIAGWLRDLRAAKGDKGRQTVRNVNSSFRAFLDWVQSPEAGALLAENPLRTEWARKMLPKRRKSDARFATSDDAPLSCIDIQAILNKVEISTRLRARIALAFTAPLRDGEIAGLRLRDVQKDAVIPFVDVHKACVANHKDGYAKLGRVKKEWSNRKLPLHPAAAAGLREWLNAGWEEFVGRPPAPDDPVFPRDDGHFARPKTARDFREALRTAGLPTSVQGTDLVFHDARGCAATWLVNAGVDGALIRRFLGQAPLGAAEERYFKGNLLPALAEAQKKITLVWPGS
ncbi:MAG TPA: tyrosine-type recombinase/integrase [Polyangiaceae bacterium]|nr:tyrosine-type recombinase/integrase [Polyangiaceae bacterium]